MIGAQAQVPVWSDLNSAVTPRSVPAAARSTPRRTRRPRRRSTPSTTSTCRSTLSCPRSTSPGRRPDSRDLRQEPGDRGRDGDDQAPVDRQIVTNGDGIVAQCATGGASATISLIASPSGTAWGYDAIVRNWLRPGAVIDVGTTADTDSLITAGTVTAVAESPRRRRRSRRPRHLDDVGHAFRVHREPELGDRREPGAQRAPEHGQHHGRARAA
jgi:hypothetical protein